MKTLSLAILIILSVIIGGGALFLIGSQFGLFATGGGIVTGGSGASGVTAGQCELAPSLTTTDTDLLNSGTSLSPTAYYRYNNAYWGTTSPTFKTTASILFTNTSYLAVIKDNVLLDCGANPVTIGQYAYAVPTLTYYSDSGLLALTNTTTGGAYNETAKSAGGGYNWKLHFQGTDKKSTGSMMIIVELSTPANVSSASLSGATHLSAVPNGYTRQGTNMYADAWIIPAVTGNTAEDHNLAVTSATSKIVNGAVYTTVYLLQPFVETDGIFNTGTAGWDSINTAKYASATLRNFFIAG